MTPEELEAYLLAQHQEERKTLFDNEAFAILMLQTVSLAASIALTSQLDNVAVLVGQTVAAIILSALLLALALAVVAAFFRHQYKMWGVKTPLAQGTERTNRIERTKFYLTGMRLLMGASTYILAGAIVVGITALWIGQLR